MVEYPVQASGKDSQGYDPVGNRAMDHRETDGVIDQPRAWPEKFLDRIPTQPAGANLKVRWESRVGLTRSWLDLNSTRPPVRPARARSDLVDPMPVSAGNRTR